MTDIIYKYDADGNHIAEPMWYPAEEANAKIQELQIRILFLEQQFDLYIQSFNDYKMLVDEFLNVAPGGQHD